MNHQDKISEYKRVKGLLVNPYPKGLIKATSGESYKHLSVKSQIVHWLLSGNNEVYTEANFKGMKGRADIISIFKDGSVLIIEGVSSESKKSMENKEEKYPFPVVFVKVNDFDYQSFKI